MKNLKFLTKSDASKWIKSVIDAHAGKNIRHFSWLSYVDEKGINSLGGHSFLRPCEGKVVDQNEDFTLIKNSPSKFHVVANHLMAQRPQIGDKVHVSFYKLKRFDGTDASGIDDPYGEGGVFTFSLTGAKTLFPVRWEGRYLGINDRYESQYTEIRNPYLRELITQMEDLPADESGRRKLVNILTDAKPSELSFNDPTEEDSCVSPPAIRVRVNTSKLIGMVEVAYDRASDTYTVGLQPDNGAAMKVEGVHFDQLSETLLDGIDDGEWEKATVKILVAGRRPRLATSL